jgi:restriction endonuclease
MIHEQPTAWRTYEEVAVHLLDRFAAEFGLEEVQGVQSVPGRQSGTSWRLEGKGVHVGGQGFVIVECRRHTTEKLKQENVAGLAWRIQDTGAEGGILVTPIGLQEGAAKVAAAGKIIPVLLDAASTTTDYFLKFLNSTMIGASARDGARASDSAEVVVKPTAE